MPTYKTKDGIDRTLPGIGRTVGGQITTDAIIENPMFEIVSEGEEPAPTAEAATPQGEAPAVAPQPPVAPQPLSTPLAQPPTVEEIAAGVQDTTNQTQNEEQK